jgi:2-polyprenyl-3-methyl-5-hydroxy-6-metoxy-1,4-benzoquinol methylase
MNRRMEQTVANDSYFYPDKNDSLTVKFIAENQPFKGYWVKSESLILERMKTLVQNYTQNKHDAVFLDAGCGTGRLLPEFARYFSKILAIDPDERALTKAKEAAEKSQLAAKVVFQNVSIEKFEWEKTKVNTVLSSHVLQHVHTQIVPKILSKFTQLSEQKGLLLIMTCHSQKKHDCYMKTYEKNGKVVEEVIGEDEFNSLLQNEQGILPVHFFSQNNFFKMLRDSSFEVVDFKTFHILNSMPLVDHLCFRDRFVNFFPFLQKRLGRDMFVACRRT